MLQIIWKLFWVMRRPGPEYGVVENGNKNWWNNEGLKNMEFPELWFWLWTRWRSWKLNSNTRQFFFYFSWYKWDGVSLGINFQILGNVQYAIWPSWNKTTSTKNSLNPPKGFFSVAENGPWPTAPPRFAYILHISEDMLNLAFLG